MKQKLLLAAVMAGSALAANAYDYNYLTFETAAGEQTSVAVESLVLTVSDGQIVASNAAGTSTFTLTDLSKMFFSTSATAVAAVGATEQQTVKVYNASGMYLGDYASITAAKEAQTPGVYVMKTQGKTIKVVKQ